MGRPVYLFCIHGRKYYVTRGQKHTAAFYMQGNFSTIEAPPGMSYQHAALMAAPRLERLLLKTPVFKL